MTRRPRRSWHHTNKPTQKFWGSVRAQQELELPTLGGRVPLQREKVGAETEGHPKAT